MTGIDVKKMRKRRKVRGGELGLYYCLRNIAIYNEEKDLDDLDRWLSDDEFHRMETMLHAGRDPYEWEMYTRWKYVWTWINTYQLATSVSVENGLATASTLIKMIEKTAVGEETVDAAYFISPDHVLPELDEVDNTISKFLKIGVLYGIQSLTDEGTRNIWKEGVKRLKKDMYRVKAFQYVMDQMEEVLHISGASRMGAYTNRLEQIVQQMQTYILDYSKTTEEKSFPGNRDVYSSREKARLLQEYSLPSLDDIQLDKGAMERTKDLLAGFKFIYMGRGPEQDIMKIPDDL